MCARCKDVVEKSISIPRTTALSYLPIMCRRSVLISPSCADDPQTDGAYIVRELPAGNGYELLAWCVADKGLQISSGWFAIHVVGIFIEMTWKYGLPCGVSTWVVTSRTITGLGRFSIG
jgi:hypothetical protein